MDGAIRSYWVTFECIFCDSDDRGGLNCVEDAGVAGAAAEVSGEAFLDL